MLPAAALGGPLAAIGEFVLLYMELATAAMVNQCQSSQAHNQNYAERVNTYISAVKTFGISFFAARTF